MKRVILHIDSLILKGFRHEDRQAIAAGLQRELARLLNTPHSAEQLTARGDQARLRLGNIPVERGAQAQRIGVHVARSIGKGLRR